MSDITRAQRGEQHPTPKFLRVNLNYMFGEKFVDGVLEDAELPEDLTDRTILISGRTTRTITAGGARQLLSKLAEREPKEFITTQMSDDGQMAFQNAIFDLRLDVELVYLDYQDIPSEFVE